MPSRTERTLSFDTPPVHRGDAAQARLTSAATPLFDWHCVAAAALSFAAHVAVAVLLLAVLRTYPPTPPKEFRVAFEVSLIEAPQPQAAAALPLAETAAPQMVQPVPPGEVSPLAPPAKEPPPPLPALLRRKEPRASLPQRQMRPVADHRPLALGKPQPDHAPSMTAATPGSPLPTSAPTGGSGLPPPAQSAQAPAGWDSLIASWLAAHRSYPEAARRGGDEGVVAVHFSVGPDGRVLEVNIVRGSGFVVLDDAARNLLVGAQLPPPGVAQSRTVRIHYRLEQDD